MKITDTTIGIREISLDNNETLTQTTCFLALAKRLDADEAAEIASDLFTGLEELNLV